MEQNDTSKSITQSRHDSPWQKFLRTGSVEDMFFLIFFHDRFTGI